MLELAKKLARSQLQAGQIEEAIATWQRTISALPTVEEPYLELARLYQTHDQLELAVKVLKQGLGAGVQTSTIYDDLAQIVSSAIGRPEHPHELQGIPALHRYEEAILYAQRALSFMPQHPQLMTHLAELYLCNDELGKAGALLEKVLKTAPKLASAHWNFSRLAMARSEYKRAEKAALKALKLDPNNVQAHYYLGMLQLRTGNLDEGWEHFKIGIESPPQGETHYFYNLPAPMWHGESLEGKTLLLASAGGIGELLRSATCLLDLKAQTKQCYLVCPQLWFDLFRKNFPDIIFIPMDEYWKGYDLNLPETDYKAFIEVLPFYFRKSLSSFPENNILLSVVEPLAELLFSAHPAQEKLKVGILWSSLLHWTDLKPLLNIKEIEWISLESNQGVGRREELKQGLDSKIILLPEFNIQQNPNHSASLLRSLDAVLTGPSLVSDLAGAVGTKTYLLVEHGGLWQQLGTDSYPWFSNIQVHYSSKQKKWRSTLKKVAEELKQLSIQQNSQAST